MVLRERIELWNRSMESISYVRFCDVVTVTKPDVFLSGKRIPK